MIILSCGMPRAGSGWYYNLTHDLILSDGGKDMRIIRERYHLQSILTEVNCNIGVLSPRRMLSVLIPSILGNTFVIKAHAGPTPISRLFIALGWMKVGYIYRDPRDAMLSAYENGQRAIQKGRPNAFSHLVDFDTALNFIEDYVRISEAWCSIRDILHTRYEDLLFQYDAEVAKLIQYLGVDSSSPTVQPIVDRYRPEQARGNDQKGLHFSKGKIGRFQKKFTDAEQKILGEKFESYLIKMKYPILP